MLKRNSKYTNCLDGRKGLNGVLQGRNEACVANRFLKDQSFSQEWVRSWEASPMKLYPRPMEPAYLYCPYRRETQGKNTSDDSLKQG